MDFRIISGSEAVIPISVEAGEPIVEVTINGRGPFPRPYEAIMTRLDRFDIAKSRIERPATRFPSNRMAGWPPFADVDGNIGYEILRQFLITL
jgi:hypothetical protein